MAHLYALLSRAISRHEKRSMTHLILPSPAAQAGPHSPSTENLDSTLRTRPASDSTKQWKRDVRKAYMFNCRTKLEKFLCLKKRGKIFWLNCSWLGTEHQYCHLSRIPAHAPCHYATTGKGRVKRDILRKESPLRDQYMSLSVSGSDTILLISTSFFVRSA